MPNRSCPRALGRSLLLGPPPYRKRQSARSSSQVRGCYPANSTAQTPPAQTGQDAELDDQNSAQISPQCIHTAAASPASARAKAADAHDDGSNSTTRRELDFDEL